MSTRPHLSPAEVEEWMRRRDSLSRSPEMEEHLSRCESCRALCGEVRLRDGRLADTLSIDPRRASPSPGDPSNPGSAGPVGAKPNHRNAPRVEGYRIVGVLGQGGMGIVYHAVQTKLNRAVALKVLPAVVGHASPSAVDRFRREATAAARLHHTHIVPVYDFGESDEAYYYAMELIDGQPLNSLIRRFAEASIAAVPQARVMDIIEGCLVAPRDAESMDSAAEHRAPRETPASTTTASSRGRPYFQQVAMWLANIADALHYAHGQGIIHRDIKPANLILCRDGRIMLTDFGLAKSSADESVTQTGALLGTVRYLSPEQAMARRVPVDHRTDLFSLGAVLYELLCFHPAFPGRDEKQVIASILTRDPIPPRRVSPVVPVDLETICLKLLEKAPASRYATARDVADDLRRFTTDRPIVGKRAGWAKRAGKFVRRHKAATIAAVAIVALSGLAVFARMERQWRKTESARLALERERSREELADRLVQEGARLHRDGDLPSAERRYREALGLRRGDVAALANLARLKKDQYVRSPDKPRQLLIEAVALCNKALEAKSDALVLNIKGVTHRLLGQFPEAIEAYLAAADLKPNEWSIWNNLGVVQAETHDFSAARESMAKAIDLATKAEGCRVEPLRNFATLQWGADDESAASWITRAIDCKRDDPGARAIRARILTYAGLPDSDSQALLDVQTADELTAGQSLLAKRAGAVVHARLGDCAKALAAAHAAHALGNPTPLTRAVVAVCSPTPASADDEVVWDDIERMLDEPPHGKAGSWVDATSEGLWIEPRREWERVRALTPTR